MQNLDLKVNTFLKRSNQYKMANLSTKDNCFHSQTLARFLKIRKLSKFGE